jgi:hypothetical protein
MNNCKFTEEEEETTAADGFLTSVVGSRSSSSFHL